MRISDGQPEDHPTPLPYDPGASPAVAGMTPVVPGPQSGPTPVLETGERDLTGERLDGLGTIEAECSAAQSAGMSAENGRRDRYAGDILPLGAAYGDAMTLPVVPTNAIPPTSSDLYPWQGDEPVGPDVA